MAVIRLSDLPDRSAIITQDSERLYYISYYILDQEKSLCFGVFIDEVILNIIIATRFFRSGRNSRINLNIIIRRMG